MNFLIGLIAGSIPLVGWLSWIVLRQKREIDYLQALLEEETLATSACPSDDPLHFHHDGCPSCDYDPKELIH